MGQICYCFNILIGNVFMCTSSGNLFIPNKNVSVLKQKLAFTEEAKPWTVHFKKGEKQLHVKQWRQSIHYMLPSNWCLLGGGDSINSQQIQVEVSRWHCDWRQWCMGIPKSKGRIAFDQVCSWFVHSSSLQRIITDTAVSTHFKGVDFLNVKLSSLCTRNVKHDLKRGYRYLKIIRNLKYSLHHKVIRNKIICKNRFMCRRRDVQDSLVKRHYTSTVSTTFLSVVNYLSH